MKHIISPNHLLPVYHNVARFLNRNDKGIALKVIYSNQIFETYVKDTET